MTEPTLQPPTQPPYPTADQPTSEAPQGGILLRAWQRFVVQAVTLAVTVGVFAAVAKGIRLAAPTFDRDPLSLGNFPFYAGAVVGVIVGAAARYAVAGWFARRNLRRR